MNGFMSKVKSSVRTALPLSRFRCSRQVFVIWDVSEPTWGSTCCCYQSWHSQERQPEWSFKLSQVSANSQTCWIQPENSTNVTYVKRGFAKKWVMQRMGNKAVSSWLYNLLPKSSCTTVNPFCLHLLNHALNLFTGTPSPPWCEVHDLPHMSLSQHNIWT